MNQQLSPTDQKKYKRFVIIFACAYATLIIFVGILYFTSKKGSTNPNSASGLNLPVYGNIQQKARNSKRQVDLAAIQTQLEAYFSQNGFYPSFKDLNSAAWVSSNMSSLDANSLADPLSNCVPASGNCLSQTPKSGAYAYQPTTSTGGSCEQNDTNCAKYTLTATYEGTVNGATTLVKTNLD